MIKPEARILGIDDSPFDKFKDKKVLIIGAFFRGGSSLDGVLTTYVEADGSDATDNLIYLVKKSKFLPQLQAIVLGGIAVGGFNIVDIKRLSKKTKVPVIVVMRGKPEVGKIKNALKRLGMTRKLALIDAAGKIEKAGKVYIQRSGISLAGAIDLLEISCTHSNIPEPLRAAHLIAAGVVLGESKGKA